MICYETYKYQIDPVDIFAPDVPFNADNVKWKPGDYTVNYNEKDECFELEVTWVIDIDNKWNVI
tara:strand:+ start:9253 stop:9444 length:192 start_codon:yes stop_codon:yes gene_type:complete